MAKPSDERRSVRTTVLLAGTLKCREVSEPVRIANLSANGALIFGEAIPDENDEITLVLGKLEISGWIAWKGDFHAGVSFDVPVDPASVLPRRDRASNLIVKDTRTSDFRRPGFRGNQLTSEEQKMLTEWKHREEPKD